MATSPSNTDKSLENSVSAPPADEAEFLRLKTLFEASVTATRDGRQLSERDRDYYDGAQWTADEREELEKRNQPSCVFNHISPKVNFILGTEIATRVDPETKPRTKAHEAESEAWTDMLRYYADKINFAQIRSDYAENMVIEGLGAIHFAVEQKTRRDGSTFFDLVCRHIEWDRIVYDHMSKRRDFADDRWRAIVLWMDLSDAKAIPGYDSSVLDEAVSKPSEDLEETFEDNPEMWAEKEPARVRVVEMYYKIAGKWAVAHLCGAGFARKPVWVTLKDEEGKSWCPMMLAAAFRTRRTATSPAVPYGPIRNMISPQEVINKTRSKIMHQLNQAQVWEEEGSFTGKCADPVHMLQEVAKPDGHLTVRPKALADGAIKVEKNLDLAAAHVQMLAEAKQEIDAVGPSAPVISGDNRVRSGRAEQQRSESSSRELAPMFESMRDLQKRAYRAIVWFVRQFVTEETWLSVTDEKERTGYRFVALNRKMSRKDRMAELLRKQVPLTEAIRSVGIQPVVADELMGQVTAAAQQQVQQQAMAMQQAGQQVPEEALQSMMNETIMGLLGRSPLLQEELVYNDVGSLDIDIVLTETPESTVVQQEEFDKITELASTGMVKFPPEFIVDASQLRNKRSLREVVKAPPPDPIQQEIQKIQIAMMQAEVEKKKAETVDTLAHAEQRKADAQFKVGPMAMKTQAQALDHAASAGNKVA